MRRPRGLLLERRSAVLRTFPHFSVYSQVSPRFSLFCFHRKPLRRSEHLRPSVCLSSTDLQRLLLVRRRGASSPFQTRVSMADCWTPVKPCLSPSPPPAKPLAPIRIHPQAHVCTAKLYQSDVNTGLRGDWSRRVEPAASFC